MIRLCELILVFIVYVDYTDLAMSTVTQRQSIAYSGTLSQLYYYLSQLSGEIEKLTKDQSDRQGLRVFKAVTLTREQGLVTLEVTLPIIQLCLRQRDT